MYRAGIHKLMAKLNKLVVINRPPERIMEDLHNDLRIGLEIVFGDFHL